MDLHFFITDANRQKFAAQLPFSEGHVPCEYVFLLLCSLVG